jgi:hypothetical protein
VEVGVPIPREIFVKSLKDMFSRVKIKMQLCSIKWF